MSTFPSGYLDKVQQEYNRFFHLCQNVPLLIVNADELDFVDNNEHFDVLLQAIDGMQGSRRYLSLRGTV